jgi:coenzyme F420-0:L-glutamate ligase / coenzyme F420-1:gamma-L-glutamate ligase
MSGSAIMETILRRRSIRRYRPDRVPRTLVIELLTAAIWAPSAHNRQPWRFCVIESQAQKEKLARAMGERLRADLEADGIAQEIITADFSRSYERITSAPLLVLLCLTMEDMDQYPDARRAQNEYIMSVQSTAMAGQNLLLAAHSVGLGACWMCAPLFCPDVVTAALDLPATWQPQGLLTLGYPLQTREKARKSLDESVVWR